MEVIYERTVDKEVMIPVETTATKKSPKKTYQVIDKEMFLNRKFQNNLDLNVKKQFKVPQFIPEDVINKYERLVLRIICFHRCF